MTGAIESKERTNRSLALFGTILFHALILLFLIWYVIITPIPPYPPPKTPEVQVALDFGNNINGTGSVEQDKKGDNPNPDNTKAQTNSNPVQPSNPIITSNVENNPSVNTTKKPGKVDKQDTTPTPPTVSPELASVENKFKHSKGNPGGNGNSGQEGNAGNPNGTTPGVGNGNDPNGKWQIFLTGRKLVAPPNVVNTSQDQGKVVVEIIVDQGGAVIDAKPGAKGSTTSSPYLYQKAKEAAMVTKFSKSPDGTPQQQGTITIVFVIQ
jgi:hypothetical protein